MTNPPNFIDRARDGVAAVGIVALCVRWLPRIWREDWIGAVAITAALLPLFALCVLGAIGVRWRIVFGYDESTPTTPSEDRHE